MLRPNAETVGPAAPGTGPGILAAVRRRYFFKGAAVALDQVNDVHFQASLKNLHQQLHHYKNRLIQ
jgi:hypothetical protein